MRSVMAHQFSQVPKAEIQRSSFDRSHGYKTTFDSGYLIPVFVDEVLPGDTFNLSMNSFARLATPLHPFMDNMFYEAFFFFCPYRLIWDNFQRFMGEQDNPTDTTDYLVPIMTAPGGGGYAEQSIFDYMGLPTKVNAIQHSALPFRAYNLLWNQWFRDQNLQTSLVVSKGDGPDTVADYAIRRRGKRHDYFTSSLPWPQKGPSVAVPIGGTAPVTTQIIGGVEQPIGVRGATSGQTAKLKFDSTGTTRIDLAGPSGAWTDDELLKIGNNNAILSGLMTDLTTATAATINTWRQAFQVQRIYERDARGGTRYTEIIQAHFGVTSPDARLQRVEYLGGGSTPLNVNPIAQTSANASQPTPQGNLAAMGTVHGPSMGFTKSFTEHGVVIGVISVRADLNYQQGMNKMWSRRTRFDFYWPALSHIGEQAVYNREIYMQGNANDDLVFGYQERFAEYRYKPSTITGKMRSNATTPLDTWHLAQKFTALPVLNAAFIQEDPPVARVIAVPSEPHFILDTYIRLQCARPMPVYSVPGLIDHF